MRFQVPQFIEVEAKVIGPLTWKQFVYVGGGVGALVILFVTTPFIVFIALGIPIGALSASLAFHKINNRPLSYFLESVVNYFLKHKLYLWKRSTKQSVIKKAEEDSTPPTNGLSYTNTNSIHSLSHSLEVRNPYQE